MATYAQEAQRREEEVNANMSRWVVPAVIVAAVLGLAIWALSSANNHTTTTNGASPNSTLNANTPIDSGVTPSGASQ